jgi:hypothetical protein
MAERKVVPFDEFYYQLKLMHICISETPCIIQGDFESYADILTSGRTPQ